MAKFSCERCRCYQLARKHLVLTQLFLAIIWSVLACSVALAVPQNDITTRAPVEAPPIVNVADNATTTTNSTTIKLGVYMESLCPDTRRFFVRQLVPTQRVMGEILELDLVPFGHARTLGNDKMLCQHGPRECEGNRRMACILVRSKNQTAIVETFGCLLRLNSSPSECLAKNLPQLNSEELEKCTAGDESYQLMLEAEKKSGRLAYVPHLTVDGKSSDQIQDQAEHHLKDYMCKLYTGSPQPEPCKNGQSS